MVQEIGLELLVREDNLASGRKEFEDLRLALLASGSRSLDEVYPEYFAKKLEVTEDSEEDVLDNPDVDYDYSEVEWLSPSEAEADELALLEQFMGETHVSVSPADLSGPTRPGEWV